MIMGLMPGGLGGSLVGLAAHAGYEAYESSLPQRPIQQSVVSPFQKREEPIDAPALYVYPATVLGSSTLVRWALSWLVVANRREQKTLTS
jgi:hypothetical protein